MKKTSIILFFLMVNLSFSQIKVGNKAPNFKLWLMDGSIITNKETANKVVVLKFWFTTCVPCITGIPKLNKLVDKYKNNKGIIFIAPALDNREKIKHFLSYYPFDFNIAYNSIDVAQVFNPKGIYPTYIIIDKKGNVAYIDSQTSKVNAEELEKTIKLLL